MRIAVTANLKKDVPQCTEHPPSDHYWDDLDDPKTVHAILKALRENHHECRYIPGTLKGAQSLARYKPDLVFNFCEGYFGVSREAQMPAIFDMLRLPYTGSGVLGMSLSHDKHMAKQMFLANGLPTAAFMLITDPRNIPDHHLRYPLFVKPAHEGTSIGINENAKVYDREQLEAQVKWVWDQLQSPILVEEFIDGREFTVSVLGDEVLPIVEIVSPTGYYSNEQKEELVSEVYRVCPAPLSEEKTNEMMAMARRAMNALQLTDFCRMDTRMDKDGNVYILEVNPLPLLYPDPEQASFVYSARAAGYSYNAMVQKMVTVACNRLNVVPNLNRAYEKVVTMPELLPFVSASAS